MRTSGHASVFSLRDGNNRYVSKIHCASGNFWRLGFASPPCFNRLGQKFPCFDPISAARVGAPLALRALGAVCPPDPRGYFWQDDVGGRDAIGWAVAMRRRARGEVLVDRPGLWTRWNDSALVRLTVQPGTAMTVQGDANHGGQRCCRGAGPSPSASSASSYPKAILDSLPKRRYIRDDSSRLLFNREDRPQEF